MSRLVLALFVLLPGIRAWAQEAWPEFRGPAGDGRAVQARPPVRWGEQENVVWKTPIPGRGWSSPVVWGDRIWLTTATPDGTRLYALCLDRDSGQVIFDKQVFAVAEPDEIHSFNSYASCTPVVEAGRVYVHFGSYGTACLDADTAQVIWERRDLPCDHFRGPGSSPILFENLLIVHFDGFDYQYVVALDKESGETVWRTDRDIDYGTDDGDIMKAFATPLVIEVDGQWQLISPTSKAALAYDPRTGEELWRVRYGGFSTSTRPLFSHGLVFLNTGFSKAELLAVRPDGSGDVTDSHVAWRQGQGIGSKPSHVCVDGLLYGVHDSGVATCLEARTGRTVWKARLTGEFSASPLYAGGHIYLFSERGPATVMRPGRTFQLVAENWLDAGCMASPAVSADALIVRTRTHLYRIETTSN